jgi:hypothetical protein
VRFETPPSPQGNAEQQLREIRAYLFRLVERLNIQGSEEKTPAAENTFTPRVYTELREMIGTNAETAKKLDKDKVNHKELVGELENALRKAEQSGDFDGNGIDSVAMDEDYRLTLGFTDGTFYTTPPLKGVEYEVGDVFVTTREGDPSELLGYGEWTQLADEPVMMWKRIA